MAAIVLLHQGTNIVPEVFWDAQINLIVRGLMVQVNHVELSYDSAFLL